jgi:hypothetical protein
MSFCNFLSKNFANSILILTHVLYIKIQILMVYYIHPPFIMLGYINLLSMAMVLKSISYCHVMNNIREYLKLFQEKMS